MIVSKLAAILRVANALDKDHLQKSVDLKISREGDQIVLTAQNVSEMAMGRIALAARSDFFTEIFGKKVILREAAATQ
jgi:exopolyphosphatase/guanosine-5'-triphosphate,3'-diphosphate pyrophosphatase